MQLNIGDKLIPCMIQTLSGNYEDLESLAAGKKAALYLMRDYACVLAQYELSLLAKDYEKIRMLDAQVLAVVQTGAPAAARAMRETELPFPVLCDAKGMIYRLYGAGIAENMQSLGNDATMTHIHQAKEAGFVHGEDEGNPLQLPAVVLFDENGIVHYTYFGKTGDDVPPVSVVADALKSIPKN